MKKCCLIILFLLVYQFPLFTQTFIVSGVIKDVNTKEPLPFANITVRGTGTIADVNGKYRLALQPGDYELTVSYIGFKTQVVQIFLHTTDISKNIDLCSMDYLLQAVNVYSTSVQKTENEKLSNISLQSERIGKISSVFQDVFRSLQALPGISVDNELSAKFNVRGGNFDENLVLINGAQVYEPFHLKEATYASIGIFNVDLMRKVDLMTGGFNAEYGDKMSSVLNIEYREGDRETYKGSASISLTSVEALAEGPITEKGSFIIGLRKSYFEYMISYFGIDNRIHPSFYDVQGSASYHLTPKNNLLFQFIHSGDDFRMDPLFQTQKFSGSGQYKGNPATYKENYNDFEEENAQYFSSLFDLQSINLLSGSSFLKAEISYYDQIDNEYYIDTTQDRTDIITNNSYFTQYNRTRNYKNNLHIKTLNGKLLFSIQASSFHELKTGLNYQSIFYNQDLLNSDLRITINNTDKYPDTNSIKTTASIGDQAFNRIDTKSFKLSAFIEDRWQIHDRLIANIGGRIDYFDINKDLNVSPRISFSYSTPLGTVLRAAWGYYYQSPLYGQLRYSYSTDSNTQAQRATHYILGIEHVFPVDAFINSFITCKLEAYYKKYDQLISSDRSTYWQITYSKVNDAIGFAKGLDLYAVFSFPDYYGWVSYGLLSTKEDKLKDNIGEYPRYTDQRHTISIVNDFNLGKKWSFNLRLFYGSGYAYTPNVSQYNSKSKRWEWIPGAKNSAYLPYYNRTDIRLDKEFTIADYPVKAFLDVTNLFNQKNIMSYRYTFNNDGTPKLDEIKLFPIIPSFGITVRM